MTRAARRASGAARSRRRVAVGALLASCAAPFIFFIAASAEAAPVSYLIDVEITSSSILPSTVGDIVPLSLVLESTTPDENPATGSFSASATGSITFTYILTLESTASSVDASTGDGTWSAAGLLTAPFVGDMDWVLTLSGQGLTADQILPDFDVVTGGTLTASTAGSTQVTGDVIGVTLVPEPGTATLVAIGFALLGRRRRPGG